MKRFKLDKERINSYFSKSEKEAEVIINDSDKTNHILDDATIKLNRTKDSKIKRILEDISLMIGIVKDWASKRYTKIPFKALISILAAVIYFVTPIDAVPDFIAALGFLDDSVVVGFVLKQIDSELQEYKNWKALEEKNNQ